MISGESFNNVSDIISVNIFLKSKSINVFEVFPLKNLTCF